MVHKPALLYYSSWSFSCCAHKTILGWLLNNNPSCFFPITGIYIHVIIVLTQCLAKPSSLTTIPGWEEWNDTRAGRVTTNPGTRRGGKMPGMGRLQSRNHTAYKDGTKVSKLRRGRWSTRAVKTGGSGHSYLGKGPAPEICLCPIRNCNILGLVLHCFELCH